MRGAILVLTGLLLAAAGPALAQTARKMAEHGDWATYSYQAQNGKVCYVLTVPKPNSMQPGNLDHGDMFFFVSQRPGQSISYEPQFIAGYTLREGSKVAVTIGDTETAVSYVDDVSNDNPSGYWRLGEQGGTTVFDLSGNALNGVYTGSPILGVAGALSGDSDSAVEWDGSGDAVVVPHDPSLASDHLTVELWLRPEAGLSSSDSPLMKTSNSSRRDGYGFYYSGGNLVFFINDYSTVTVSTALSTGAWVHIAATYDGSHIRLFENGVEVDSRAYDTPINHSSNDLLIGQGVGSTSWAWIGGIDEACRAPNRPGSSTTTPVVIRGRFSSAMTAGLTVERRRSGMTVRAEVRSVARGGSSGAELSVISISCSSPS